MSDRGYSREQESRRSRRRSPSSRSPSPKKYSRSPSHRSKRSSPNGRRAPNEVHRENPIPSACLGVFGLSQHTVERDLKDLFQKFGRIKDVQIVIDKKTNKSRGFGFIYFEEIDSAIRAKEELNATELDHHRLRIDYSTTKRAHTPTPGIYMGVRTSSYRSNGHSYRRSPSPDKRSSHRRHHHHHHRRHHDYSSRSRSRSRTRSRSRSRRGGRRRSPGYAHD